MNFLQTNKGALESIINASTPLVSIVTINFNNAKITCELLDSLRNISYKNIEIIVVDNASINSVWEIENFYPEIQLILCKENSGFAGGNNEGIKRARGKYILLLNNDTEVDENFLEPLVSILEKDKSIGAVSPKICYHSNPEIIQFAGGIGVNLLTGRGKVRGKNSVDTISYNTSDEIKHGHGAALLISKKAIDEAGLLYEGYFLYYEELDYCNRLRKAGYKIWYEGTSKVFHKESMSVGKNSPFKIFYLTRNRLIYLKRNTNLLQYPIAMLFFFSVSLPKNFISYLVRGKATLALSILRGVKDFILNFK